MTTRPTQSVLLFLHKDTTTKTSRPLYRVQLQPQHTFTALSPTNNDTLDFALKPDPLFQTQKSFQHFPRGTQMSILKRQREKKNVAWNGHYFHSRTEQMVRKRSRTAKVSTRLNKPQSPQLVFHLPRDGSWQMSLGGKLLLGWSRELICPHCLRFTYRATWQRK